MHLLCILSGLIKQSIDATKLTQKILKERVISGLSLIVEPISYRLSLRVLTTNLSGNFFGYS